MTKGSAKARPVSITFPHGFGSKLLYATYLLLVVAALLELSLRGYYALQVGPRVLVYGTPWYQNDFGRQRKAQLIAQYDEEHAAWDAKERAIDSVMNHDNQRGGYQKFFPNETKYFKDIDTGEIVPVTINTHGFRGPDYSIAKPGDVIRVLTLGASSTFGFFSRDHETYPRLLQQKLNERCSGQKRFEVINFAIPHARAEEIRAMLVAEGMTLKPDVITFYEGRNDSDRLHPMDFRQGSLHSAQASGTRLQSAWNWATHTFILARLVDQVRSSQLQVSSGNALESLDRLSRRTSKAFLLDLDAIRALAAGQNILFIVANQQASSKSWFGIPEAQRRKLSGVTYANEVSSIQRILRRGEPISGYEFNFLIHAQLMQDLEAWAKAKRLPFVDIIELLDQDRHHLVSWVHLDAYGNGVVADALASEILPHVCKGDRK